MLTFDSASTHAHGACALLNCEKGYDPGYRRLRSDEWEAAVGWLRDAWKQAGFEKIEQLANALRAHEKWPDDVKSARTIANHLGKLDKQQDHHWWEKNAARVEVLADVINWEPERLKAKITRERREVSEPTNEADRFVVATLGRVRALQLAVDELPPGVPELARRPSKWSRHWWACSDVRALELVGRWLQARAKATFVTAHSLDELKHSVPAKGRVFALLSRDAYQADCTELADCIEFDELAICVAAPFSWNTAVVGETAASAAWTDVATPPMSRVFGEVADWVEARIESGRRAFDSKRLALLTSDIDRLCAGPCDVIDLLSFVAAHGTAKKLKSHNALTQEYLAQRGKIARIRERVGSWITNDASTTLTNLMKQVLKTGIVDWSRGLTRGEWAKLMPESGTPQQNVDRALKHSQEGGSDSADERFEEIARLLVRAEERAVANLVDAELLVRTSLEHLELAPRWLAQMVHLWAYEEFLMEGRGEELGVLLLQPAWSEVVLNDMLERVIERRAKRIVLCLDETEGDLSNPPSVAFNEAFFRVLGIAALIVEEIPDELVDRVTRLQAKTSVQGLGGVPVPSIPFESTEQKPGLGSDAVFHLAAMSLWRGQGSELRGMLSKRFVLSASRALAVLEERTEGEMFVDAAYRLVTQVLGDENDLSRVELFESDLTAPVLVYMLADTTFAPSSGRERAEKRLTRFLDRHEAPARIRRGLTVLDGHRGVSLDEAVRYLWQLWMSAPSDDRAPVSWGGRDPASRAWLWRFAEPESIRKFLDAGLSPERIDVELAATFAAEAWDIWLERWLAHNKKLGRRNGQRDRLGDVFVAAPVDVLRQAIKPHGLHARGTPKTFAALWSTRAEQMLEILEGDSFELAVHVAVTSPASRLPEVLGYIKKWSEYQNLDRPTQQLLVDWLRLRIPRAPDSRHEVLVLLRSFGA